MVGKGKGGERRKRGGRPSSSRVGACGDTRTSFLASTNDSQLDYPSQSHGFIRTPFSLNEEARNTERHRSWNSDLKLRYSHIAFVSAGTSTVDDLNPVIQRSEASHEATNSHSEERDTAPMEAFDNLSTAYTRIPDAQMSKLTLNEIQYVPAPRTKLDEGLDSMPKRSDQDNGLEYAEAGNKAPLTHHHYVDGPSSTCLPIPIKRRSPSSTGSDSSEEVIIFAGRRQSCNSGDPKNTSNARARNLNAANRSKSFERRSSICTIVDDPLKATVQQVQTISKYRPISFSSPELERPPGYLSSHSSFTTINSRRRGHRREIRKETRDEGVLDDYVANLRESGAVEAFVESSILKQRDLGTSDTAEWLDEMATLPTGNMDRGSVTSSEIWDSAEEGPPEFRPANGVLRRLGLVLSKRERPSGMQSLVVEAGRSVDDAHWFPVRSLNIQGAEPLIQEFENNARLNHIVNRSDISDTSLTRDEQLTRNLSQGFHDEEDEKDLEERSKARTADAQIARLLSKHDELGLESDNSMLYDGGDVVTDNQDELQLDGPWERAVTHRGTSRSKKMKRSRSKKLSATAYADVLDRNPYDTFDSMDQQTPSLHKRPKGRRGKLSLELSDSELECSIRTAWEKDRTKKKMRKQEREELRAQGLLGKKPEADLKAKYFKGISTSQVKKEIRDFLLSSMASLSLPPMAHGERKIVHEIANVFKLKSKSLGGGASRHPVLYRTSRTIQYSEETLKAAESVLFSGRFLPTRDRSRKKGALADRGRRGGTAGAGVSYRDGEVVGAAAPEIGQENRGRTMLERMGWSTGTALGALNNSRGLVQPVAQVVKTSRSGLG